MAETKTETAARRIFIVDDHPVFREGLAQIVNGEGDLHVCGSAGTVAQALRGIERLRPDLVLVDISLPDKTGIELIKDIRSHDTSTKLLVVSMHDEALYANRVLRAGGDGYIMKQEGPKEIIEAMRDVLEGHIYVSEEVLTGTRAPAPKRTAPARKPLEQLSDWELEVLELLGQGKTHAEMASRLGNTQKEIADASKTIQRKLRIKTENALIRYAVCWVESAGT